VAWNVYGGAEPVNKGSLVYLPTIQKRDSHRIDRHADGTRSQDIHSQFYNDPNCNMEQTLCLFEIFSDKSLITKHRAVWPIIFSALPAATGGMEDPRSLSFMPCALMHSPDTDGLTGTLPSGPQAFCSDSTLTNGECLPVI